MDKADAKEEASAKVEKAVKAKAKQSELPGMEEHRLKDVEDAAEEYAEARDARMAAGLVEVERKVRLIQCLRKRSMSKYKRGPITVELKSVDNVKVRIKDESAKAEKE